MKSEDTLNSLIRQVTDPDGTLQNRILSALSDFKRDFKESIILERGRRAAMRDDEFDDIFEEQEELEDDPHVDEYCVGCGKHESVCECNTFTDEELEAMRIHEEQIRMEAFKDEQEFNDQIENNINNIEGYLYDQDRGG